MKAVCWLQVTDAQIKEARAKAARTLTNIDDNERKRRIIFGVGLTVSLTPQCHCCPELFAPCPSCLGIRCFSVCITNVLPPQLASKSVSPQGAALKRKR